MFLAVLHSTFQVYDSRTTVCAAFAGPWANAASTSLGRVGGGGGGDDVEFRYIVTYVAVFRSKLTNPQRTGGHQHPRRVLSTPCVQQCTNTYGSRRFRHASVLGAPVCCFVILAYSRGFYSRIDFVGRILRSCMPLLHQLNLTPPSPFCRSTNAVP